MIDDREYVDLMLDLTSHDGWKILIKDMQDKYDVINSVSAATDNDDLNFRKGQLEIIASLLNHRDSVIRLADNIENFSQV